MRDEASTFHLFPHFFTDKERPLLETGVFRASGFRYESGVAALRLQSDLGELILLPFQGQQIWSAGFGGRDLTMKSMFDVPKPTQVYVENYGAFFLHCGVTAMGGPSAEDTHPLHGELPNAPYHSAQLLLGHDEHGDYLGLTGTYQHTVAFQHNYRAEPLVKLYAGSSILHISLTVTNLKQTPMELMYLAHTNFRPVDHGRLVYSAICDPAHVRVRQSIPGHITPGPGYVEFIEALAADPAQHNVLRPELSFDPEVVFYIDYLADEAGWAHSLHIHPDGQADYIAHQPHQLDKGVRWICRTPDQDALGIVEAATAEPEGYLTEKAKGNLRILEPGEQFVAEVRAGTLAPEDVAAKVQQIEAIIAQA